MARSHSLTADVAATRHLTSGLPAVRIGWNLSRLRRAKGRREREVVDHLGISVRTLRRWESGAEVPADAELLRVAELYGVGIDELLPARDLVELDVDGTTMRVGQAVASFDPSRGGGNEAMLGTYLTLVREQRGLRADDAVKLRHEDLAVLATVLDLDDRDLEDQLMRIMGISKPKASVLRRQLLRRRLVAPAAGLAVGAVGALGLFALNDTGADRGPSGVTVEQPTDVVRVSAATTVPEVPTASTVSTGSAGATAEVAAASTGASLEGSSTTAAEGASGADGAAVASTPAPDGAGEQAPASSPPAAKSTVRSPKLRVSKPAAATPKATTTTVQIGSAVSIDNPDPDDVDAVVVVPPVHEGGSPTTIAAAVTVAPGTGSDAPTSGSASSGG